MKKRLIILLLICSAASIFFNPPIFASDKSIVKLNNTVNTTVKYFYNGDSIVTIKNNTNLNLDLSEISYAYESFANGYQRELDSSNDSGELEYFDYMLYVQDEDKYYFFEQTPHNNMIKMTVDKPQKIAALNNNQAAYTEKVLLMNQPGKYIAPSLAHSLNGIFGRIKIFKKAGSIDVSDYLTADITLPQKAEYAYDIGTGTVYPAISADNPPYKAVPYIYSGFTSPQIEVDMGLSYNENRGKGVFPAYMQIAGKPAVSRGYMEYNLCQSYGNNGYLPGATVNLEIIPKNPSNSIGTLNSIRLKITGNARYSDPLYPINEGENFVTTILECIPNIPVTSIINYKLLVTQATAYNCTISGFDNHHYAEFNNIKIGNAPIGDRQYRISYESTRASNGIFDALIYKTDTGISIELER